MNTTPKNPGSKNEDQRKDLEKSEKKATREEPENYKDEPTDKKIVEIGPDVTDDPIKGIDAPERTGGGR